MSSVVNSSTQKSASFRELSETEVETVNGGGFIDGAAAMATGLGIGTSVWGASALGTIGVAAAFAAAPIAAAAMVGLAAYGGYAMGSAMYDSFS